MFSAPPQVLRHDHGANASGIGGAQAGTEIVRVLHAVEDQDERTGLAFENCSDVAFFIDTHLVVRAGVAVLSGDCGLVWTVGAHVLPDSGP